MKLVVYRRTCLLLLLLLAGQVLHAQKLQLSGVVRDSVTEEPMALVTVFLEGTQLGSNTNLDGEFLILVPPGDYRLVVRAPGYETWSDSIHVEGNKTGIEAWMRPVSHDIEGLTISSRDINPSHRIVKQAIRNRRKNRFDKIDSYEYEAYNKLVITMDQVTDQFLESKLVRGVGREVRDIIGDSSLSDTSKYKIAAFVSESVSRFYYKRPDQKKEEILAVKTSGVKGSEYNLLSSMFLQLDMYDNNVVIVDRTFLSPIADGAFVDYDYELVTMEAFGMDTLFGIRVSPKRPYDPVFKGMIYIDNQHWALNRLDLVLNENPNINFVEDIRIRQEYARVDSFWVPTLLDVEVDFQNSVLKRKGGEGVGIIGRTSSHLYNYKINEPKDPRFYKQEVLEIKADAEDKDSLFWTEHRKTPLEKSEQIGYSLVDSLQSRGVLDFYIEAGRLITWGTYKFEKWELGPYFYLLGYNPAEGWRTRLGAYTRPQFSKRLYMGGHLAYGLGDQRLKYQGEVKYRLVHKPKLELGIKKTYEVEQVGVKDFLNNGTSLLQTSLRRVPLTQLNYYHENRIDVYSDLTKGLSGDFYARTKSFDPAFTFPFGFDSPDGVQGRYDITEVGADLRISFKEEFITNQRGNRVYIGTKFPILFVEYRKGFGGLLNSDFDYQKIELGTRNFLRVGRYGWLRYDVRAGQIFGDLPFPSLHVFSGNQTWGYDRYGFNMMNYYEFVADRYATVALEHHFEGLFWNMLPGLRKLKWKEVVTARVAYGTLTDANLALNNVNVVTNEGIFNQQIKAPDREPYLEAGVGLYNILKVLRVDAIWRLNYHDLSWQTDPSIPKSNWGKFNNFGLRVDLDITF